MKLELQRRLWRSTGCRCFDSFSPKDANKQLPVGTSYGWLVGSGPFKVLHTCANAACIRVQHEPGADLTITAATVLLTSRRDPCVYDLREEGERRKEKKGAAAAKRSAEAPHRTAPRQQAWPTRRPGTPLPPSPPGSTPTRRPCPRSRSTSSGRWSCSSGRRRRRRCGRGTW